MNSEAVWTSRIAFLFLTVLLTISGVARGDGDALKIRWDIQHYPNFVLQPGGEAFADAADSSKIRLTGSGTFKTDGDDVTGGGTWETFAASGTRTGSGSYRVLKLVSWYVAPGALPVPADHRRDRIVRRRQGGPCRAADPILGRRRRQACRQLPPAGRIVAIHVRGHNRLHGIRRLLPAREP
jgi:hypothetical protein